MFTIEKNVPVPAVGGVSKYPFSNMDINDSFMFPYNLVKHISSSAQGAGLKLNRKFMIRKLSSTEGRCWRIK